MGGFPEDGHRQGTTALSWLMRREEVGEGGQEGTETQWPTTEDALKLPLG